MAIKTSSQEGKQALAGRLMLALRRSSAAGVLHGQTVARRVGVNSTDGQVSITITDTGEGIPAKLLPHVFERFVKAPSSTGSGLAAARAPRTRSTQPVTRMCSEG